MLVDVCKVNGLIDEREMLMIHTMSEKLNLSDDLRDQVISGTIHVQIKAPEGEWERIPFFQMCVMTSGVNGDFDARESLFCKKLGLRLGLRDEVLDQVIRLFKEYFPETVPLEDLKKAYRLSHN